MSSAKFSRITSGLLARKGEAQPSVINGEATPMELLPMEPAKFQSAILQMRAAIADGSVAELLHSHAAFGSASEERRRIVVTLRKADFERLSIVALKHEVPRPHLVHELVLAYLNDAAKEYSACSCLAGGETCGCK